MTSAVPAVHILSPGPGATGYAPIFISATTTDPTPVTAVHIYVDNALVYQVSGTGVQASLFMSSGQHYVVVQAWNAAGATYKSGVTINVPPVSMTISSPATSPITIVASAPASSPVQKMQVYFDGSLFIPCGGSRSTKRYPWLRGSTT